MNCKHDGPDICLRGYLKRNDERCRYYEPVNSEIFEERFAVREKPGRRWAKNDTGGQK
jgi:hypothetical protein